MIRRRGLLGGLLALAAPAIIRTPGLLMPVRPERYVHVTPLIAPPFYPISNLTLNDIAVAVAQLRLYAIPPMDDGTYHILYQLDEL